jgi:excisionase family DNA binding protein
VTARFNEYADVVTVDELAEMLKIGRNTAYRLLNSNQIPSVRVGRQRRIRKADVAAFITKNIEWPKEN